MKADKTFFIDFTNSHFNYFHNGILSSVVSKFLVKGDFVSAEPYGSGHINETKKIVTDLFGVKSEYILHDNSLNSNVLKSKQCRANNSRVVFEGCGHNLGFLVFRTEGIFFNTLAKRHEERITLS